MRSHRCAINRVAAYKHARAGTERPPRRLRVHTARGRDVDVDLGVSSGVRSCHTRLHLVRASSSRNWVFPVSIIGIFSLVSWWKSPQFWKRRKHVLEGSSMMSTCTRHPHRIDVQLYVAHCLTLSKVGGWRLVWKCTFCLLQTLRGRGICFEAWLCQSNGTLEDTLCTYLKAATIRMIS